MRMSEKVSRAVVVPVIALSALALGSASFAASSYNLTAGSAPATPLGGLPDTPYTATTTGASPQVTFTNTTAGVTLQCASASAPGEVTVGTNLSGTRIGNINGPGTIWNTCTGPGGLSLTVTGSGTWGLNSTGNTNVAGETAGTVSAVNAHVAGDCSFDVTGSVDATYKNGTTTLDLPGLTSTLTISNTSFGCVFVGVANGDKASFKAAYQVAADNAAYNPIQITSNP